MRLEPDTDGDTEVGTERASLAALATPPVAGSDAGRRRRRRAHLAALPRARLRHRRVRRPSAAGRAERGTAGPPTRRPDRARGRARDVPDLRRPLRAVAQPAGTRGREPADRPGGRGGPQPAGVPLRLPALPRRRRRGPSRVVPRQAASGVVPLRGSRPGAVRRAVLGAVPDVPRAPTRVRARAGDPRPAELAAAPPRLAARGRAGALPAGARPPGERHPAAAPRRGRPGPARALHVLRRPADRHGAGPGPAGRARHTGPPLRPTRPSGPRRSTASWPRPSRSSGCSAWPTTP